MNLATCHIHFTASLSFKRLHTRNCSNYERRAKVKRVYPSLTTGINTNEAIKRMVQLLKW